MDLYGLVPSLNLYNRRWPIRTASYPDPSAKFTFDEDGQPGQAVGSIISGGCILSGGTVRGSVLGRGSQPNLNSTMKRVAFLTANRSTSGKVFEKSLKRLTTDRF